MKNKVLLVYPEIPATYWSFKYSMPFIGKKGALPPLGLMTVAAMIPDRYELKLIDMNIHPLKEADIIAAEMVFISAMIIQKQSFDHVVELCRRHGKTVVAGGPYPSSSHASIQGIDHFILNEAEDLISGFFQDIENGCAKKMYDSPLKPDITKTPVPRFDLLNVNDYNSMALQFSRGCPYNCEFCDIIEMFGRKPRTKLPGQFLQELDRVYETGFTGGLFIVDDNFIGNRRKVKELLREIIEWQEERSYPFNFFTEASIDMAGDDELLDLMETAGFDMVFIGIETPDRETLMATGKSHNTKSDLIESVRKIQMRGIEVTAGFIVGFDNDKEDIFTRQTAFIQNAAIPVAMTGLLLALPGTRLFRRLTEEGRILADSGGNNTHDFEINFTPVMPVHSLIKGYREIISSIYSPRHYYSRCLRLLKEFPKIKSLSSSIKSRSLKPLFMSIFKQGFSSYGAHYFLFLLKILLRIPRRFPEAVTLSVKGYHLFKITKEILEYDEFSNFFKNAVETLNAKAQILAEMPGEEILIELKEHINEQVYQLKKKYYQLSRDIQKYKIGKINEFEEYCRTVMENYSKILLESQGIKS